MHPELATTGDFLHVLPGWEPSGEKGVYRARLQGGSSMRRASADHVLGPLIHERPPLFEKVRPRVGAFNSIADVVG